MNLDARLDRLERLLDQVAPRTPASPSWTLLCGDAQQVLLQLPEESVHTIVTSPPYWRLRNYRVPPTVWGGDPQCAHRWQEDARDSLHLSSSCAACGAWQGCLGLEPDAQLYVDHLVQVFRAARRVLRRDGTLWLNIGDSYSGGSLLGIPWRVALALQADGWLLRASVVWAKPSPLPESVDGWRWEPHLQPDDLPCPGCPECLEQNKLVLRRGSWRPTRAYEYVFLLALGEAYYSDSYAVRQDGANLRNVWQIPGSKPGYPHYAVFPEELVRRCILSSTSERGCCALCGTPEVRVVERRVKATEQQLRRAAWEAAMQKVRSEGVQSGGTRKVTLGLKVQRIHLGWRRPCGCRAPSVPCTVLDPFAGIGTAGVVALEHGRSFIGIEISERFAAEARRRLARQP